MVDSSATSGTGIIIGTTYFFGDYDECLGVPEGVTDCPERRERLRDQFYYLLYHTPNSVSF
ncbi:unnamed protein product, partial [Oppiella nova]